MKLDDIRNAYISEGCSYIEANSRTSQDVILALLAKSSFTKNVTIKGGVVLQHISGDSRRATQDFDFDFIRYSLSGESIAEFIKKLSETSDDVDISITAPIEELKHQDYNGKRIYIRLTDNDGTSIDTKLDIGVHKDITMEQDLYCFDLSKLDDSVNLLVNTKEQMFAEKLKSLLRLGNVSTRYKDVFDMFWLTEEGSLDKSQMVEKLKTIIFDDTTMREVNPDDIVSRLERIFSDSHFISSLRRSKRHNWLQIEPSQATAALLDYFRNF
jgi:predicted nucleotidyltransferase component of viral defense system